MKTTSKLMAGFMAIVMCGIIGCAVKDILLQTGLTMATSNATQYGLANAGPNVATIAATIQIDFKDIVDAIDTGHFGADAADIAMQSMKGKLATYEPVVYDAIVIESYSLDAALSKAQASDRIKWARAFAEGVYEGATAFKNKGIRQKCRLEK